jgi:peptidyl-dipeptidase Dcp
MELYYCRKLFGITFKEVFDIDKYHEDVQTFEVLISKDNWLLFHADFSQEKENEMALG